MPFQPSPVKREGRVGANRPLTPLHLFLSPFRAKADRRDGKWHSGCRGLGGGGQVLLFNGFGVPVWEDDLVLEMGGGNGYTAM